MPNSSMFKAGPGPVLSDEQCSKFAKEGVLVVRDFFTVDQVKAVVAAADEAEAVPEAVGNLWKYFNMQEPVAGAENIRLLDRIENFADKVHAFNELFLSSESLLTKAVGELFGEPALLWKEKMNFKKPGSSGFAPHQDAQAGWLESGQTVHISVAVNVDPTTIANGCLSVVRGVSGPRKLLGPVRDNMSAEVVDEMSWEDVPCGRRDIIFFDSFVPHRSEPNKTDFQRRVALATYAKKSEYHLSSREEYFESKLRKCPPDAYKKDGESYRKYMI